MITFSKPKILLKNILKFTPLLILFLSVLNKFDLNYQSIYIFSFNFPFILIFYWSLKKSESLGFFSIFVAGLINDVVVGLPIGISSLAYLLICGFSGYLRNITLRPNLLKDWLFFLFTILVINSLIYILLILFFSINLKYHNLLINIFFTFIFYIIFAKIFDYIQKIIYEKNHD